MSQIPRTLSSRLKVGKGYAPGSWSQVAVERTKPRGRIVGIDIIPAQPPKGVSTIQGNFLSEGVQAEVKRFLEDPDRGRPIAPLSVPVETADAATDEDSQLHAGEAVWQTASKKKAKISQDSSGRMVDVVLSDMSEPWPLDNANYWKKSLSDPYIRMMNTSGINYKDHAGSMVRSTISVLRLAARGN
jgi:21S rRNA (uridine2791-2'-O)-methyltransferase